MDHRPIPVAVEYDTARHGRKSRHFADAYAARRFYVQMDKQNRAPTVRGASTMCPEITKSEESVATTPAPAAVKAKPKKDPAKKAAPKAKPKKAAPKENAKTTIEYGIEKSHDVPWNDKKVAVIKALKSLKAFGAADARSAKDIAEKASLSTHDVRHYCYHAKVSGLTGVADIEGIRGYAFYLTAKGQKCDPAAELKSQQSK
jgi:ribosomal protein L7/L12